MTFKLKQTPAEGCAVHCAYIAGRAMLIEHDMADCFNPRKRSEIMASVRSRDTNPEVMVRSIIHRLGYRFRLHRRTLPGTPDIVLPKLRKIVFVHGCFWHAHQDCRRSAAPKSNSEFWLDKQKRNSERDLRNLEALSSAGWDVAVVWQCELKFPELLKQRLQSFLRSA